MTPRQMPHPPVPTTRHSTSRTVRRALAAGAVVALSAAACTDHDESDGTPQLEQAADDVAAEHDYVIPPGTGERLDAGEEVEIVPLVLDAVVGETIRIVNDDDRGHVVGVFFVGAGETLTQTFTSPGEFTGTCTVHTDGEFTLRVSA